MDIQRRQVDSLETLSLDDFMPTHRIRLQGPWEWSTGTPEQGSHWSRVKLPAEWGELPAMTGEVSFLRRFHLPTGILPEDRVFIAIPTQGKVTRLLLNSRCLQEASPASGQPPAIRVEVTSWLAEQNQLVIGLPAVDPTRPDLGLGEPITLEIESERP